MPINYSKSLLHSSAVLSWLRSRAISTTGEHCSHTDPQQWGRLRPLAEFYHTVFSTLIGQAPKITALSLAESLPSDAGASSLMP